MKKHVYYNYFDFLSFNFFPWQSLHPTSAKSRLRHRRRQFRPRVESIKSIALARSSFRSPIPRWRCFCRSRGSPLAINDDIVPGRFPLSRGGIYIALGNRLVSKVTMFILQGRPFDGNSRFESESASCSSKALVSITCLCQVCAFQNTNREWVPENEILNRFSETQRVPFLHSCDVFNIFRCDLI